MKREQQTVVNPSWVSALAETLSVPVIPSPDARKEESIRSFFGTADPGLPIERGVETPGPRKAER